MDRTALLVGGLIIPAAATSAGSCLANSSASVEIGDLVMVETDAISIQRGDLTLSVDQVRVRHEMRNDKGAPVTLRVAFAMPEVPIETPAEWTSSAQTA